MNESIKPKRLLLGKRLSTKKLEGELLPKSVALPIFSSDPLSSVAYGPQEMLMILALGGFSFLSFTPAIASVVVLLLTIVVLSYRKVIAAYPSGGGDYEVAKKNLGEKPAIVVASALLIDYVLTVAVSIAAGTDNIISAFPELDPFRIEIAAGFIILLCAVNLRGVRESGIAFALPTYLFISTVFLMLGTGIFKLLTNQPIVAPSAEYEVVAIEDVSNSMLVLFLLLRAFASGSAALTGVEAIANGVPAFREPKIKNAQATMAWMGFIAISMFIGIITFGL
ncbi:MAG: hypothetical protein RI919_1089, partial [Actinomycetota bacterium]